MQIPSLRCVVCYLLALVAITAAAQTPRFEVVAKGLEHPWAVAFIGDGQMLVTERPGRLRVVAPNGALGQPVQGLPAIDVRGQGGLLDVVVDSAFRQNRTLYFCFSEPAPTGQSGNSTALARARLSADARRLDEVTVIFRQLPKVSSSAHFGCRIVESLKDGQADGTLFLTLGDRFSRMQDAQTLDNHHGKVVRIGKDGSVPKDNPFVQTVGAKPEIWSYGHRNPQGATLAPGGGLWMHEHGPQGGDEINVSQSGKNYGWPVITYGENYGGGKIGEGLTAKAGLEQPLHYWAPSIAPSGMAFVTSDKYGSGWRGNLLVGSLKFGYLNRIVLDGRKVVREEKLLGELNERIRDVRQGPDGLIYVLTDASNGQLIRLLPP
jgi:glucose/arabinose dehydrogenase